MGSRRATASKRGERVALPDPARDGAMPLESALARRRSLRDFRRASLTLAEVAQVLWATQGISHPTGLRTAPSAGALYPLECHLVAGKVTALPAAVYRYDPARHELHRTVEGDRRAALAEAALSQTWMARAAAVVVLAAVERRTSVKYGARGTRYVHIEAGHAGQNACLQATALGLGTTVVGAFDDERVSAILDMGQGERPLCLLALGRA